MFAALSLVVFYFSSVAEQSFLNLVDVEAL